MEFWINGVSTFFNNNHSINQSSNPFLIFTKQGTVY